MRFVRKGGVWKNTEDEILKAAVMKYGKNQWARISSLLVRKSAKQCKARWYEWLDPSVKKTEWTREEEEKLLHLAKIMPSQWRSIAAIVGRTSTQCLEHYTKLLDQAQAMEDARATGSSSSSSAPAAAAAAAVSSVEELRKLRPGEIDMNPETKPARPDPVDMDEDEKEMLSEARARLANTKGKKAKRKAREKQLEEARRLAVLQKRRELKAAGIQFKGPSHQSLNRRKRKEMDYNAEIPLHRPTPAGFFDTGDEDQEMKRRRADTSFLGRTLKELDGRRRDELEEQERKKDAKRQALMKKHDLPAYVAQIAKLNDPQLQRARPALSLPAPQVTDRELRDLAALTGGETPLTTSTTTGLMMTPYAAAAAAAGLTPMRTPRAAAGRDALVLEAQNLLALERSQTPLAGGENAYLHPSDVAGAARHIQTPNALLLAQATPRATTTTTPTPTPRRALRDEFGINVGGGGFESTPAQADQQEEHVRRALRASLSVLPQPTNEYALALPPQVPTEPPAGPVDQIVPDADDVAQWEREARARDAQAAFRRLSTVLQRPELPVPAPVSAPVAFVGADAEPDVHAEMLTMLRHDASRPAASSIALDDDLMAQARALVDDEAGSVVPVFDVGAWERRHATALWLAQDGRFATTAEERVRARQDEFDRLRQRCARLRADADAAEQRAASGDAGALRERVRARSTELVQLHRTYEQALIDRACFDDIARCEAEAIPARIATLRREADRVVAAEGRLQDEYSEVQAGPVTA